ncbi:transcriptional regulator [Brachybacterium sp. UMB0905]|uniref:transcriptional regulator n=1 Tax=Brachybacterium sp. UMB0905 TaxID=2069310 RepID=UPI000C80B998|nr:transcriptional regulator [Brachybacterium sp. UMB0905]PMC75908.1 transcriptional regulator [Brachybacterium sp. UMB0905]
MTDQRVRFRDIKPYSIVDSLDELTGPSTGCATLPVDVHWSGPQSTFNLQDREDLQRAYQSILSNGRPEHLVKFINKDPLLAVWPILALDRRVLDLWCGQFLEIAAIRREF